MRDTLNTINSILTWRFMACLIIPLLSLMSFAGLSIKYIMSIGISGVIASVLSLREDELK